MQQQLPQHAAKHTLSAAALHTQETCSMIVSGMQHALAFTQRVTHERHRRLPTAHIQSAAHALCLYRRCPAACICGLSSTLQGSLSTRAAAAAARCCLQQPSVIRSNSVCSSRGQSCKASCTPATHKNVQQQQRVNSAENCSCIGGQQTHSTHAVLVCMAVECGC